MATSPSMGGPSSGVSVGDAASNEEGDIGVKAESKEAGRQS